VPEKQIPATEFKSKCLAFLDEVAAGASFVITKRGKPVARIERASPRRRPLKGGMRGTAEEAGDIVHFDSSQMWKLLR
jgi:prevent-host-death family protein